MGAMAVNILNNIERNTEPNSQTDLCSTTPSAFIERYCSKLNIPSELIMVAKFVSKKLEAASVINDNTPHSVAAGIIYFVATTCSLNISKTEIRQICGVSEVTINKCFKKMDSMRAQLIPQTILEKYDLAKK